MGNCWNQRVADRVQSGFQTSASNYHSHIIQQRGVIKVKPQRSEEGRKLTSAPQIVQPEQYDRSFDAEKNGLQPSGLLSIHKSRGTSQRDSLEHLGSYQHIHFVRPPSYTESEGRIAKLQSDSGEIWNLIRPEMKLMSREPYRPNLSWIREETKVIRT